MSDLKRKAWKWGKVFAVGVVIGLLGLSVGSGCASFAMSDAELAAYFAERGVSPPEYAVREVGSQRDFVAQTGAEDRPSVVFVHGSPGSWDNFAGFLGDAELREAFHLAAVDRPGFGRSRPLEAVHSLAEQAKRIYEAARAAEVPLPAIWVGHSLGGPVVARLAVDYPDAVSGLVLVAPSISPELEKRRWYNWVAKFPLVKAALSPEWRISNEEIFSLKPELETLATQLPLISVPVVVVQGTADRLVPPGNADYVEAAFTASPVRVVMLAGADHFIPWSHREEMLEAIRELAASVAAAGLSRSQGEGQGGD